MQLDRQLEIWERDEKWDKIIKRLEKIKPLGRTPEMNLLLSSAYIRALATGEPINPQRDRETFEKALEALSYCAPVLHNDSQWNANKGTALMQLQRYGEALPYLKKFAVMAGNDIDEAVRQQLKQWFATCKVYIRRPPFSETFSERVKRAWELFVQRDAEIRNILDQNPKGRKLEGLLEKCQEIINVALDNEFFHVTKKDERYRLTLTGTGSLMRLFEAQYFKEHAPESVLENWDIIVGQPISEPRRSPLEPKDNFVTDTKLWIRENNGIFYIDAYSSKAPNVDEELPFEIDPALASGFENFSSAILFDFLLLATLGEIVRTKFTHLSEILQSPFKEQYLRVFDLADYLKEHGIDIHASPKSLLNQEVNYTFPPKAGQKRALYREDVISGKTMCMPLLINFQNGNESDINMMEAHGATTGFIYYGTDIFSGDNQEEEMAEFREYLKKRLTEKFGPDELKIIGDAHGVHNDYIDVVIWDTTTVFDSLRVFLEGIPKISYSVFQVFRKSTEGLLLTGDEAFKKSYQANVVQPADILNPAGIDYPTMEEIEKERNKKQNS